MFESQEPAPQPSRSSTMELDYVLVQSLNLHMQLLDQRMGRMESTLDKILERLQLLGLNENNPQVETAAESGRTLPISNPTATSIITTSMNTKDDKKASGTWDLERVSNATQVDVSILRLLDGKHRYTALDTTKSEIRILAVECATNFSDPIRASLKTLSLDEQAYSPFQGYTSLSYCWGPPVMDGSIILDGYHFPVTESLETALRYLRYDKSRSGPVNMMASQVGNEQYWWIDQLCINQADVDERGDQVSLMRRIYKRASGVHVWLGDEADDSSTAISILETLGAPPQHAPGEKAIRYPSFTDAEVVRHWNALNAFFKRPWWERVWIRQEIALHWNVKISCGTRSCDMTILGPALFMLNYVKSLGVEEFLPNSTPNLTVARLPWDFHPMQLVELTNSTNGGYTWIKLSRLLLNARGCKATDSKDTVFSVLGLADSEVYPIVPNYHLELREVLIAAARAAIGHEWGLDFFAACQNPKRKYGLPSWVPNLVDDWKTMPFRVNDYEGKKRITELDVTDSIVPEAQVEGEVLILGGGLVDAVQVICQDTVQKGADAESLEAMYISWRRFIDDAASRCGLEELEAYYFFEQSEQEKVRAWVKMLSVFGDKADDLGGYSTSGYSTLRGRRNRQAPVVPTSTSFTAPDWKLNPYHHMGLNFRLGRSYLLPPSCSTDSLHPNRKMHAALRTNCVGRCLCITKRGFVALVPDESSVGDRIALFQGASFPYLLWISGGKRKHVLVGEAFIPRYTRAGGERLARHEWGVEMKQPIELC